MIHWRTSVKTPEFHPMSKFQGQCLNLPALTTESTLSSKQGCLISRSSSRWRIHGQNALSRALWFLNHYLKAKLFSRPVVYPWEKPSYKILISEEYTSSVGVVKRVLIAQRPRCRLSSENPVWGVRQTPGKKERQIVRITLSFFNIEFLVCIYN